MKLFNSFFIWLVLLCSTINFSQASVSVNKLDIFAPLKAIKQTDFPEEQFNKPKEKETKDNKKTQEEDIYEKSQKKETSEKIESNLLFSIEK